MHIFLTGEKAIGKSRMVRRISSALGLPVSGFLTRFPDGERGKSALYMVPADKPDLTDEAHRVAEPLNGRIVPIPGRFDLLGAELLREARKKPGHLILMDECGRMERDALLFQREILACLDGTDPVLGVLRKDQPWHDFIRNHPRVQVITVTEENRNILDGEVLELLKKSR